VGVSQTANRIYWKDALKALQAEQRRLERGKLAVDRTELARLLERDLAQHRQAAPEPDRPPTGIGSVTISKPTLMTVKK
jgi:hypothetical protein